MSRGRLLLLLVMGCLVGAFFALDLDAYLSLSRLQAHQEQASAWVQAHFGQAALLFTLLYVVTTALSLPGASLLTLGGSALFGVGWGLLLVSFASSLGATLAFLSARFLLRDWVSRRFGDKLATFEAGMAKDGAFYLLSLRLIPLFPFFLINLLMGLTPIRVSTYYWVSQLGMLPGTFVYVLAGSELASLTSTGNILSPGLVAALTLLGLMPWLMRGLQRRLALRRLHAPYRKPARFDYNLLVVHNRLADQELALPITGATTELLGNTAYQDGDTLTIPAYGSVILRTKGQAAAVELGSIPDDAMDTSDVTLDIQVHVPENTPTDAKLYMPNSDDGWDPTTITVDADTTLERVDANTFHIRVTRPRGTRLEYKFFRGGWDSSETDADGNWTGNRIFLFVDDSSQVDVNIQGWRDTNFKG